MKTVACLLTITAGVIGLDVGVIAGASVDNRSFVLSNENHGERNIQGVFDCTLPDSVSGLFDIIVEGNAESTVRE